ncbi:MAG: protein kinase domain-containing protein, partial [Nannocystaceae bacterium]
ASTPSSDLFQVLSEPDGIPDSSDAASHDTDDTLEPVVFPTEEVAAPAPPMEWRKPKNRLTMPGALVGTPHYMAPELWRGQPASRASDIYAMGVVMRILLVGSPPHAAMTPYELLAATEDGNIEPTASLVEGLHPDLAEIVDRCLQTDPSDRFATGDALRAALEAITSSTAEPPPFRATPTVACVRLKPSTAACFLAAPARRGS